ncbi:MAG: DUF5684 domain-containing protein [Planctomycetaceae bacterium]|nr:DUF5684 domain-containing protein [Planctomycetaceae bacterium]
MEYEGSVQTGGGVMGMLCVCFMWLLYLAVAAVVVIGMWKAFVKAKKPGWAAIIPIYNIIVILEMVGRPVWWVVLFLVPCVNIVMSFIVMIDVAKSFAQSAGFGVGLALLGPIFWPILGFGKAQYVGPAVPPTAPPAV